MSFKTPPLPNRKSNFKASIRFPHTRGDAPIHWLPVLLCDDADFLSFGDNDPEALKKIFTEMCQLTPAQNKLSKQTLQATLRAGGEL